MWKLFLYQSSRICKLEVSDSPGSKLKIKEAIRASGWSWDRDSGTTRAVQAS